MIFECCESWQSVMVKVRTADGFQYLVWFQVRSRNRGLEIAKVRRMRFSTMEIDRGGFVPYVRDEQLNVSPTAAAQHFLDTSGDLSHVQHKFAI